MGNVTCNSGSWRKIGKNVKFGPYPTTTYGGSGSLPKEGYNWDKKLSMCMWLVVGFFGGWDDVITTPIKKIIDIPIMDLKGVSVLIYEIIWCLEKKA